MADAQPRRQWTRLGSATAAYRECLLGHQLQSRDRRPPLMRRTGCVARPEVPLFCCYEKGIDRAEQHFGSVVQPDETTAGRAGVGSGSLCGSLTSCEGGGVRLPRRVAGLD
jgi:hypothetical protein